MAVNPVPLGRRQVEVLRPAADGTLVRFDSGTRIADGWRACARPGQSVKRLGLVEDVKRIARLVLGGGGQLGTEVGLSSLGEVVLEAWDKAHPRRWRPSRSGGR